MKVKLLIELLRNIGGDYHINLNSYMKKSIMAKLNIDKTFMNYYLAELTESGILKFVGKDTYSCDWANEQIYYSK